MGDTHARVCDRTSCRMIWGMSSVGSRGRARIGGIVALRLGCTVASVEVMVWQWVTPWAGCTGPRVG
jgi:hypothetical protein